MEKLVAMYLEAQEHRWSASTLKSERYRLAHVTRIDLESPSVYYRRRREAGVKPYSLKTEIIRIGEFVDWLMCNGHLPVTNNLWKDYLKSHGKLFKYAYQREKLNIDYAEALRRINTIRRKDIREKALQLLGSGMRFTESGTLKDGQIIGKGGKPAPVFIPASVQGVTFSLSYDTFRKELKRVGLKPHTLRKLAATEFRRQGATEADLLRLMRWNSMQTAAIYLQAEEDKTLNSFVNDIFAKQEGRES